MICACCCSKNATCLWCNHTTTKGWRFFFKAKDFIKTHNLFSEYGYAITVYAIFTLLTEILKVYGYAQLYIYMDPNFNIMNGHMEDPPKIAPLWNRIMFYAGIGCQVGVIPIQIIVNIFVGEAMRRLSVRTRDILLSKTPADDEDNEMIRDCFSCESCRIQFCRGLLESILLIILILIPVLIATAINLLLYFMRETVYLGTQNTPMYIQAVVLVVSIVFGLLYGFLVIPYFYGFTGMKYVYVSSRKLKYSKVYSENRKYTYGVGFAGLFIYSVASIIPLVNVIFAFFVTPWMVVGGTILYYKDDYGEEEVDPRLSLSGQYAPQPAFVPGTQIVPQNNTVNAIIVPGNQVMNAPVVEPLYVPMAPMSEPIYVSSAIPVQEVVIQNPSSQPIKFDPIIPTFDDQNDNPPPDY